LRCANPIGYAEQRLYVVPDFVSHYIGLCEIARRVVAVRQIVEEGHVQIKLVVAGAVERPHRCAGVAAGRLYRPGEQYQFGLLVTAAILLKQRGPYVLRIRQHDRHEILQTRLLRARRRRGRLLGRFAQAAGLIQNDGGVDSKIQGHQRQHDGADSATRQSAPAHAHAAPVFDVVAASSAFPAHARLLQKSKRYRGIV